MENISLKAMAKINLSLDVLRRREDGYHEVRMIMQTINMYDKLTIEKTSKAGIELTVNLSFLPTDSNNLIYKAADLLMTEFGIKEGVKINLEKHIPVAAGMAGGSSDAAATLFGVNRLFNLELSNEELMQRAVKIGADVPYCIMRGTALSEGIGEKLTPLQAPPQCFVLIAKPPINVSTKYVYSNLKLDENTCHPDVDKMIESIEDKDLNKMAALMGNVLESVTVKEYPEIEEIKGIMKDYGALNSMMSGSGPTVFGLFDDESKANECKEFLKDSGKYKSVFLTEFFNP